jgi:hypothetical protein
MLSAEELRELAEERCKGLEREVREGAAAKLKLVAEVGRARSEVSSVIKELEETVKELDKIEDRASEEEKKNKGVVKAMRAELDKVNAAKRDVELTLRKQIEAATALTEEEVDKADLKRSQGGPGLVRRIVVGSALTGLGAMASSLARR